MKRVAPALWVIALRVNDTADAANELELVAKHTMYDVAVALAGACTWELTPMAVADTRRLLSANTSAHV